MKDDTLDSTYLFITDSKWSQWRMLLERRTSGYIWCDNSASCYKNSKETRNISERMGFEVQTEPKIKLPGTENIINSNMEPVVSVSESESSQRENYTSSNTQTKTSDNENSDEVEGGGRSRLSGLKQLSFAGLANIRRKISEGRRLLAASSTRVIGSNGVVSSSRGSLSSQGGLNVDEEGIPEALNNKIGGTRLSIQQATSSNNIRGQGDSGTGGVVLGGLFPETAILTFHNIELEVLPQVINNGCLKAKLIAFKTFIVFSQM